jgi:hypothetical protein
MRIGVSSRGTWWITMGPLGWLLTGWLVLPLLACWYLILGLAWLCALACRKIAASRT